VQHRRGRAVAEQRAALDLVEVERTGGDLRGDNEDAAKALGLDQAGGQIERREEA
jgi:hypothetical protein